MVPIQTLIRDFTELYFSKYLLDISLRPN